MYCFCVGKTVVHVPTGGVLKLMVTFLLTGDLTLVTLEAGGGYCPKLRVICCKKNKSESIKVAESWKNLYYNVSAQSNQIV